ncbi:Proline/betaine transporter (plasmid) [Corynebacterium occultum]|uniref:Proline/betaine transporter n=2 Tax=Corynebacterium occultum TaxID=2675219 RepID=A0A6B8WRC2_9CORY|nr:MFS transporter [Corynebacterium occultum]QGU08798.1 Proline/betaine transporter [Corynebacterium occultum]
MTSHVDTLSSTPPQTSRRARKALIAAMSGTLIEWYDYALYGAAAGLIIGPLFFPDALSTAATLAAFATFAVGFIIRPLGGVVISHIGDRYGRKPAMILTIVLMGAATVGIGLMPTAASIGLWAPILLVVFRLLQGFGAGAELAGAFTLVAETSPKEKRGFHTGLVNATPAAGTTLATLGFLLVSTLPEDVLLGWAWRVPFLFSALLFFIALYIRRELEETPEYVHAVDNREAASHEQKVPLGELFKHSRRPLIAGFLATTGHNAHLYVVTTFSLSYLTATVGMSRSQALTAVVIASVAGIVASPIGGLMTDRFGARKVLGFGGLFGALYAFPLFLMMQTGDLPIVIIGLTIGYGVTLGATMGSQGAFLTNLFPARYRFTGVATAREFNGALIAGTTPLVATVLIQIAGGEIWLAALYIVACSLVTLLAVMIAGTLGNRPFEEN